MATLAPCSAKRTAIAWPMPELPPVTSTFLPFRPGMASLRVLLGAVAMRVSWLGADGAVPPNAVTLRGPAQPWQGRRHRARGRRGHVEPQVAQVAEGDGR